MRDKGKRRTREKRVHMKENNVSRLQSSKVMNNESKDQTKCHDKTLADLANDIRTINSANKSQRR